MKLSTKGRYSVRLMIDIAVRYEKGPVMLKNIAARQEISEKYLWQLISPLMLAGLLVSKRGAHGGYNLAKSPEQITVYDIVSVLEGDMSLVDCVSQPNACDRIDYCVTNEIWAEVSLKIKKTLSKYTLQDMVKKYYEKSGSISYTI